MSLKNQLLNEIKARHEITLDELYKFCDKLPMKHETASRLLRKFRNEIEPIYNKGRKAIVGYKVATSENLTAKACCYSKAKFGTHSPDCPVLEQIQKEAKILESNENQSQLFTFRKTLI